MIITHHPLFFGDPTEIIAEDPLLSASIQLLVAKKINVFVIHTNADFNGNSIAFNQALALDLVNPIQINENHAIVALWPNMPQLRDVLELIREKLSLDYAFRTNIELTNTIENVIIGSGAAGDLVNNFETANKLLIVGEMKHHE
jgi:putative NIF3 family GTP cyclohydrolase 1 type 2